jgi:hypothetical protein
MTTMPTPRRTNGMLTAALLIAGAGLWVAFGRQGFRYGATQTAFLIGAAVLALVPGVARFTDRLLGRIRFPSRRGAFITAVIIWVSATLYLVATGLHQGRDFIPKFHDEHMYLLQMQMLARGRLWMPQHPLADFFETTHVLVKPVYAAIYFPGTALMYVPAVWAGLPTWLPPAIVSGAAVGLLYRVVTELIDGIAGALAALLLLSLSSFRYLSLIVMSHTVMVFLALAVVWAWLRWREATERAARTAAPWALALGALVGWMLITRPVDAIAYGAPLGIAFVLDLRRLPWRRAVTTVALASAAATPFLALQVALDVGVTGHPFTTPYRVYVDEFNPLISYGFHRFDPAVRPRSALLQKQEYYDQLLVPEILAHRPDRIVGTWLRERFPRMATIALPSTALLVLLPAALLALTTRPRRALAAVLPMFVALYAVFTFLLPHYVVVVAPAVFFLVLLGRQAIASAWPRVDAFSALAVAALAVPFFPELNSRVVDDPFDMPTMVYSHLSLPQLVKPPAIVLFRYRGGGNVNEEPVYNESVAWPDDAPIIRAHELGPGRDRELFQYYAARQPARRVYVFDRRTAELRDLGTVAELAAGNATPAAATTTTTTSATSAHDPPSIGR